MRNPAARLLAPEAIVCRSRTTTSSPRRSSARAADTPAIPAPTTIASTPVVGGEGESCQYEGTGSVYGGPDRPQGPQCVRFLDRTAAQSSRSSTKTPALTQNTIGDLKNSDMRGSGRS